MLKKALCIAVMSLTSAGAATAAWASAMPAPRTFCGTGAAYDLQGQATQTFTFVTVNTPVAATAMASHTTLTYSDGTTKVTDQTITDTAQGFKVDAAGWSGDALCFGNGLCQGYLKESASQGLALTYVRDSEDTYRILLTRLENGQAQGFIKEVASPCEKR